MQAFLEILIFLIAIVVCFYLPGKFLFAKLRLALSFPQDLFLPFVLGIMLFTLISYIFSWLKLEIIILPLVLIIDFVVIKSKKWIPNNIDNRHLIPLFIILILAVIFSFSMLTTGVYGNTIKFRQDDLWHLALINELKNNFPPDNPGFAGVPLKGYHFFYNFLLAKISNIFIISPFSLYFHYFPLFIAILWGFGVYGFMNMWSKKVTIALWATFLTMFGGSFAFILNLQGHKGLSLDSAFGIQQAASSLVNPPFSISIVIVIAVLFAFYKYFLTLDKGWLVPIVLCVGLVSMFKVYAGIILLGSFLLLMLMQLFKKKFIFLIAFFFTGILFITTYGIFRDPSSTLIFAPLWAPHSVLIDNMPWYGYTEKMYTYTRLSVIKGIIETELYSWYVFAFGNLGTRLIGLLFLPLLFFKKGKKLSFFTVLILLMTLISILIPLFFIQSGKVFEIIQMAWYFLFFVSLLSAFGFHALFNFKYNVTTKIVLFLIILIITLPSTYENYRGYFDFLRSSGAPLSDPYFNAMQFLGEEGSYNETVLEIPDKNIHATKTDLKRWYRSTTPAIVAFSNKRSYLSYEYIDFFGTNPQERIQFIEKILIFNITPPSTATYRNLQKEVEDGLRRNSIVFIYSPYPLSSFTNLKNIKQIYQNQVATIYRVDGSEK